MDVLSQRPEAEFGNAICNAMRQLEWTIHDFNYKWMYNENDEYKTEAYFPKAIKFIEPIEPADYKKEMYELTEETRAEG